MGLQVYSRCSASLLKAFLAAILDHFASDRRSPTYGATVNVILGGFNLIPAFPLDGGRILRPGLVRWKKDYDKATRIVVSTSTIISYALMAFGFISIVTRSFVGGLWILLVGWFLNAGAQSYLQQQELGSFFWRAS